MAYEPLSTTAPAPAAPTPAPAPVTTSGKGYVPLSSSAASTPAPVSAPTGGYQPISKVGLLSTPVAPAPIPPLTPVSSSSGSTPAITDTAISPSAAQGSLGGGYGASNETDPYSGKPLLTYENQTAKSSQLFSDRVAPTFDPTVPQKIDPSVLHNGRMPEAASEAVRKATGAEPDEQLDHLISLELGGSNETDNLNPEKLNSDGTQPSLTLENATAKAVAAGDISYVQGQKIVARAKGVQLPDDPDFSSSAHPLASAYPKSNLPAAPVVAPTKPVSSIAPVAAPATKATPQNSSIAPTSSVDAAAPSLPITSPGNAGSSPAIAPNPESGTDQNANFATRFPELTQTLADLQTNPLSLGTSVKSILETPFTDAKSASDAFNSALSNFITGIKSGAPASTDISNGLVTATSFAGGVLTPLTTWFNVANKLPVVGTVSKLLFNVPFATLGDLGSQGGMTVLNNLPISDQAKQNLAPGVQATFALASQLALGGAVAPDVMDTLAKQFGSEGTKAMLAQAQDMVKDRSGFVNFGAKVGGGDEEENETESPQPAEPPKPPTSTNDVQQLYDTFNEQRVKAPPALSTDMHDVAKAYPLTDEAKKTILENTTQTNKHIPGDYASFNESKTGKDNINISEPDDTNTFHEMIHSWEANTDNKPDYKAFQTAFDQAKSTNPQLQTIDDILSKDTNNYPESTRKYDSSERFAYVAEMYGAGGLDAIPESLRPFYEGVLKPGPSTPSPLGIKESTARAATKSAIDKETAEQDKIHTQNEETSTPIPKDSYFQKLKNTLKPLAAQDKDVQEIFKDYTTKLTVGHDLANKEAKNLTTIPAEQAWDTINRYERGSPTPYTEQIKNQFEDLFDEARSRGLDTEHRTNYLPHSYIESPEEIKQVLRSYLAKNGVPEDQIEPFLNGTHELPQSTAQRLGLNPSFVKTRTFDTYEQATDAGLHPKYTHPAQLAGQYREGMERAIANRELVENLVNKGKLVTAEDAPKGYQPVNLEFSPKGYYAKPRLASMLNGLFHDSNAETFWQKTMGVTGKISQGVQKIGLLSGVPGTDINLHGLSLLIEQITAGNPGAVKAFLRSNSDTASVKFFQDNEDVLQRMAKQGIDLGHTVADYPNLYKNLLTPSLSDAYERGGKKSAAAFIAKETGTAFDKAFSKKDFTSFMPQLMVETFKNAADRFTSQGMPADQADALAADTTRAFHGLIGNVGRSQGTKDALTTALYAPPFRESIFNTLWNSLRSVTTDISNPAFYKNRQLLGGMAFSFGLYTAANKYLNGHYIWQNPSGHQFDLQIPTGKGNFAYVPFMPSFLSVPRNVIGGGLSMAQGDLKGATQQFSSILSAPLQLFGQLYSNKDFYGNPIYADTDPGTVKAEKIASYLGLNTVPPFVKEAVAYIQNKGTMPLYQAISMGLNLPVKYGTQAKNNTSDYYNALTNNQSAHAAAIATFKPTFDNIQQLIQSGQTDQAQKLVNNLSDSDYALYKDLKSGATQSADTKADSQFLPTYTQIQTLISQGKMSQAQSMVNGLSDTDYKTYQRLKKSGMQ